MSAQTDIVPAEAERSAPHNLDAEQAFLGSLLLDNDAAHRVGHFLKARHFYDPVHGRIYAVVMEMIARGERADPITLKTRLEQDEGLQEIGGVEYIVALADAPYPTAAAPEYARLIRDLALKRELIRVGLEIAEDAYEPDLEGSADDLVDAAETKLSDVIGTEGRSKGWRPFQAALTEVAATYAAAYESEGRVAGVKTGFTDLDRKLGGLHKSDLVILAGRPSMGKTALATNIAFKLARNYDYEITPEGERKTVDGGVVGFLSLEMSAEQLAARIVCEWIGTPSDRFKRGEVRADEFERLREGMLELQSIPLHIDDTGGISIASIAARARRLKRTHGLDVLIVDYLQLIAGSERRKNDGRVQEVSEITQGLKALAKELDIPILALSQLSRQVEQRNDKRPQLSDLRESGSIEQDADVVMFVYREAYYLARQEPAENTPEHLDWQEELSRCAALAEVIVGKQRHGPIGTIKLAFDEALTKFDNRMPAGRFENPSGGGAS